MRAAVTTAPRRIELADVAEPDPGPGDAVVEVGAVGLCGTDLHMFLGERHDTGFPLRQGHEVGGVVASLPPGYDGPLSVGTTVAVNPSIPCGACRPCSRGAWPSCRSFRALGVARPGGLADRVAVPVAQLHDATGLTAVEAALVEPFSVAAMAVARAELRGDERVLIVGAGPIGLAILVCLAGRGLDVAVVDPVPGRLALAAELGATTGDPDGADTVFEASGSAAGLAASLDAVAPGGRLVVVGLSVHALTLPVPRLLYDGVTVTGARAGLFPEALAVVRAHRPAVARFATTTYPLPEVTQAFTQALDNPSHTVKVLITP